MPMDRTVLCGGEPAMRHQGRDEREHFKLASLTKPEFHESVASVNLVLYQMKIKPIKPIILF